MKKILIILLMFSFFSKLSAVNNGTAYNYEFNGINGDLIKLSQFKGKVIVVNVLVDVVIPLNMKHSSHFGQNMKIKIL